MAGVITQGLLRVLRRPAANAVLRATLKPFARWLPLELLSRLPVLGRVPVVMPSGRRFVLESDGRDVVASAIHWRGLAGWEAETFEVLERALPNVEVAFDVGASTGIFSLAMATAAPHRRVWAFEPTPATHAALRRNLELNHASHVRAVEAAASERDGTADFFIPPGESFPFGASMRHDFRRASVRTKVRTLRLDTFASEHGIARVDLVKLDTEGTEPEALAGARTLLTRDEPWILCEVLHGLSEAGLHAVLEPLGYRWFIVTRHGLEARARIVGDPTYRDRNWLFATPRRLASIGLG